MRITFTLASVFVCLVAAGCAGTLRVKPALPPVVTLQDGPSHMPVSLYLDPEIEHLQTRVTTPSGDIGLGDITVEFDLGSAVAGTIRNSARQAFANVKEVAALACAEQSAILFTASLPTPPYIQIHWRDETPRVGGGTVAELSVRITPRSCDGTLLPSAVARGSGAAENLQTAGNWPTDDDFQPGIDMALHNLQMNLADLFVDLGKARAAP